MFDIVYSSILTCRDGYGQLNWSAIFHYMDLEEIDNVTQRRLFIYIQGVDPLFLKWQGILAEREAKKKAKK